MSRKTVKDDFFAIPRKKVITCSHFFVKSWELYFMALDGYKNREKVARAFARFWNDDSIEKLDIPGKVRLGGLLVGYKGCPDGTEIHTLNIERIERVRSGYSSDALDLMCATTTCGNRYYFYAHSCNNYMMQMLSDLLHEGKLSECMGCYLRPDIRKGAYI